jgi:hypothetical protein
MRTFGTHLSLAQAEEIWREAANKTADQDQNFRDLDDCYMDCPGCGDQMFKGADHCSNCGWNSKDSSREENYYRTASSDGPSEDSETYRQPTREETIRMIHEEDDRRREERRRQEDRRQTPRDTPDRRKTDQRST